MIGDGIAAVLATRGSNIALSVAVKSSIELECGELVPIPTCEKAIELAKIAKAVTIFFIVKCIKIYELSFRICVYYDGVHFIPFFMLQR